MPGTIVRERSASAGRGIETSIGTTFVAAVTERGRLGEPMKCRSMSDVLNKTGKRVSYSPLYDYADAFFSRGGSTLYVSRILGPAVISGVPWSGHASVTLDDSSAGTPYSLVAYAASPGPWGNNLQVAVLAGSQAGEFRIQVTDTTDPSFLELSPSFPTQQSAVDYYAQSDIIRLVLGASTTNPAVVAPASLTGGVDDRVSITATEKQRALDSIPADLGPGQVSFALGTTSTDWAMLLAHGKSKNRRAICDPPDSNSKTAFATAVNSFTALTDGKYGAMFGPWVDLDPLQGGAARPVPASAVVCGAISANDAAGISPNQAAAGDNGIINVNGLRATFTRQDVDDLTELGFNCLITKGGIQKIYGFRSGVLKSKDKNWWQFTNSRFFMSIADQGDRILETFVLREVDGARLVFKELEGELTGMLLPYWPKSLYGATFGEAVFVDTGDTVNTEGKDGTIANGEIHAVIELTMSPTAEKVYLDLVKRQIGS